MEGRFKCIEGWWIVFRGYGAGRRIGSGASTDILSVLGDTVGIRKLIN